MTALIAMIAMALDALLGEPRSAHPLVGFGRLAQRLEQRYYDRGDGSDEQRRANGVVALFLAVFPFVVIAYLLAAIPVLGAIFEVFILYLAVGCHSLVAHSRAVLTALQAGDLVAAREAVGRIVSRDTSQLDEREISRATVESVLENGNDAVFGALFWFVIAGAPGVVLYRLANTLDAMWGYRNARYLHFGWAAARFDDLLNYLPARLTALSYALLGNWPLATQCWREQGGNWKSPNAGPVMAAGAGSLGLQLGGAAVYHGEAQQRPDLGQGRAPVAEDIERANRLVQRSVVLWLCVILIGVVIA